MRILGEEVQYPLKYAINVAGTMNRWWKVYGLNLLQSFFTCNVYVLVMWLLQKLWPNPTKPRQNQGNNCSDLLIIKMLKFQALK